MAKSFRLMIAVVVTCVVAATGLALAYGATKDRIADQERRAEQESLRAVLPEAESFEPVAEDVLAAAQDAAADADCSAIYEARDASGALLGWGLRVSGRGYGGPINVVLGLDSTGKVTGVTILSMSETPGLGTKVQSEAWFLEQFTTLPAGFATEDVRALDSISGSTKSSRGVRTAIEGGGRIYTEVLEARAGGEQ